MKEKYARSLLEKNRDDYNKIADIFAQKRDWIPPDFTILEQYINKGERILDLGCGNGRLKKVVGNKADYYGVDVSEKLIEIAKERYPDGEFFLAEGLSLPFKDSFFDKVFCLAVFHHIPSKKFRRDFLKEIKRVLIPGAQIVLTVWHLTDNPKASCSFFKYTLLRLIGKTRLDFKDIFYPWKNSMGEVLIYRYIHIFSEKELEKLVQEIGFIVKKKGILGRSEKGKNIFFLAQKPETSP